MSSLQNKIDFVALVSVTRANSNGDPLNGNRPRTDLNGFGEISDVCIKRKIRNRMQDLGKPIFVQSEGGGIVHKEGAQTFISGFAGGSGR